MVNLIRGDQLETRATTGIATKALGAVRPVSASVAKYAIRSGQAILVEDAETDERINQVLRAKVGDKSLICVPLFQGGEVIGTLNVMSRSETDRLDEDDRQTMEMLSVVLSAAVSHAAEFEARLAQAEALARFRTLFEGASIGIVLLGADGRAVEANPAVEAMLGYTAAQLGELPFTDYMHPEDVARASQQFRELMEGEREAYQLEARYCSKSGDVLWGLVRAVLERDRDGRPAFAVTMIENITERKRAEVELIRQAELNAHQALHDPLTGLPNRALFGERAAQAIKLAERPGAPVAVFMVDLDRFKEVNDSLGHRAGDTVLQEVSDRLTRALRDSDTVARLGGDEFGVLLPRPSQTSDVVAVAERIRSALEAPILVHDLRLAIEASIGVAMYPGDGHDADTLLQRADMAMYRAKREGASYSFYDEDQAGNDPVRETLVAELRRAMASRERSR
jgi:diguanylate cyclase (GGDEF)-like protein/PAS domain S-box-containing protein